MTSQNSSRPQLLPTWVLSCDSLACSLASVSRSLASSHSPEAQSLCGEREIERRPPKNSSESSHQVNRPACAVSGACWESAACGPLFKRLQVFLSSLHSCPTPLPVITTMQPQSHSFPVSMHLLHQVRALHTATYQLYAIIRACHLFTKIAGIGWQVQNFKTFKS